VLAGAELDTNEDGNTLEGTNDGNELNAFRSPVNGSINPVIRSDDSGQPADPQTRDTPAG
jgi:hypothetical protein